MAELGAEVVLVDDGSTDCTSKIFLDWSAQFPRTQYVHQDHLGLGASRNRGARCAQSTYVLFLDSDDILNPDGALAAVTVISSLDLPLVRGREATHVFGTPVAFGPSSVRHEWTDSASDVLDNLGGTLRFIYRRDLFASTLLSYPESLTFAEDLPFAIRLAALYKAFVDVEATIYSYATQRPNQLTDPKAPHRPGSLGHSLGQAAEILKSEMDMVRLKANFSAVVWWYSLRAFADQPPSVRRPERRELKRLSHGVARNSGLSLHVQLTARGRLVWRRLRQMAKSRTKPKVGT